MKPVIIVAIIVVVIIIGSVVINEESRVLQKQQLDDCARNLINDFKIGFGAGVNRDNQGVLDANEKCMDDYYKKYGYPEYQQKDTAEDYVDYSDYFSNLYCASNEYGGVKMTGYFTNNEYYHSTIYFNLGIIDSQDRVVATGIGSLNNVQPNEKRLFDADALWDRSFKECVIEIGDVYDQ